MGEDGVEEVVEEMGKEEENWGGFQAEEDGITQKDSEKNPSPPGICTHIHESKTMQVKQKKNYSMMTKLIQIIHNREQKKQLQHKQQGKGQKSAIKIRKEASSPQQRNYEIQKKEQES